MERAWISTIDKWFEQVCNIEGIVADLKKMVKTTVPMACWLI